MQGNGSVPVHQPVNRGVTAPRANVIPEGKQDCTGLPIVEQLLGIQQELKVAKGHANEERDFRYRSLPDILDAIKPLLKRFGCVLTFEDEIKSVTPGVVHIIGTAKLTNIRGESISANATVREDDQREGMFLSQMSGSSLSFCHKYACGNLFAIDDTRTESAADPDSLPAPHAAAEPNEKPILLCGGSGWAEAKRLAQQFRGTREEFEAEICRRWRLAEKEQALLNAAFDSRGASATRPAQ